MGSPHKAVTFGEGGRLGDNILDYTHAKWISYKWGIPLLFYNFEYSDQFVFSDAEQHLTNESKSGYVTKVITDFSQLSESVDVDTLYQVGHVPDAYEEYTFLGSYGLYIPVDWSDKIFRDMMRDLIVPKEKLSLIQPPAGMVSVALHYRDGGGFGWDTDSMKRGLPLRFPHISYYIKQLKRLTVLVGRQQLYVQLFTDHPDPESIRKQFKAAFPQSNIEFHCRQSGNRHDANVLEDMFSMTNFDCLIRPMSHFSITASHLKDFKIEFYPTGGHWGESGFIVDKVELIERARWDKTLKRWIPKNNIRTSV